MQFHMPKIGHPDVHSAPAPNVYGGGGICVAGPRGCARQTGCGGAAAD
jgi:hypothetical protein